MKRLSFSFGILVLVFIWIYHTAATDYNPPINRIIGDISYVKKFGHLPSPGTDMSVRIKTHLAYAEMILRNEDVSYGSKTTRLKREHLLDDLHKYWVAGEFPINYANNDVHNFCTTFMDGKFCAIGYLYERSMEREMSRINDRNKKLYVNKQGDQALNSWIRSSGLTKEEAALIQPSYN